MAAVSVGCGKEAWVLELREGEGEIGKAMNIALLN